MYFVLLAQIPLKIGWEITEKLNNNNREGTKMPQKIAPCNHLCIWVIIYSLWPNISCCPIPALQDRRKVLKFGRGANTNPRHFEAEGFASIPAKIWEGGGDIAAPLTPISDGLVPDDQCMMIPPPQSFLAITWRWCDKVMEFSSLQLNKIN